MYCGKGKGGDLWCTVERVRRGGDLCHTMEKGRGDL